MAQITNELKQTNCNKCVIYNKLKQLVCRINQSSAFFFLQRLKETNVQHTEKTFFFNVISIKQQKKNASKC